MGCKLSLPKYYGLSRVRGGHHDNGVAKGAGTASGKGKECACCESSPTRVRARGGGGWVQAEYYGLSVAR